MILKEGPRSNMEGGGSATLTSTLSQGAREPTYPIVLVEKGTDTLSLAGTVRELIVPPLPRSEGARIPPLPTGEGRGEGRFSTHTTCNRPLNVLRTESAYPTRETKIGQAPLERCFEMGRRSARRLRRDGPAFRCGAPSVHRVVCVLSMSVGLWKLRLVCIVHARLFHMLRLGSVERREYAVLQ